MSWPLFTKWSHFRSFLNIFSSIITVIYQKMFIFIFICENVVFYKKVFCFTVRGESLKARKEHFVRDKTHIWNLRMRNRIVESILCKIFFFTGKIVVNLCGFKNAILCGKTFGTCHLVSKNLLLVKLFRYRFFNAQCCGGD